MVYPAHFRQASNGSAIEIQTVPEHSRNTAEIAAERLRCVYLTKTGYVAGLLHDCGKCRLAYKSYLEKIMAGGPVQRGAVIHTHAAARFFLEHFHTSDDPYRDMTAELLAFATGAHHGLFDCVDENHRLGFARRLQWDDGSYQELGFTLVFTAMGALAGTLGSFLKSHQTTVNIVSGLVVIFFGLCFMDVIKVNIFKGSQRSVNVNNMGFFSAASGAFFSAVSV